MKLKTNKNFTEEPRKKIKNQKNEDTLLENRITPTELPTEIFRRQFLPTKIIPSQNLSELAVGDATGIYGRNNSVGIYRRRESFFENCNGGMTWIFFRQIYRRKYRGIQTRTAKQGRVANTDEITDGGTDGIFSSVIPSVNASIYCLCRHSLFLCLSFFFSFFFPIPPVPSQTAANHPSQLSPLLNTS
jgi:hypothetical protein